jgi:predicted transcriptional regulator
MKHGVDVLIVVWVQDVHRLLKKLEDSKIRYQHAMEDKPGG